MNLSVRRCDSFSIGMNAGSNPRSVSVYSFLSLLPALRQRGVSGNDSRPDRERGVVGRAAEQHEYRAGERVWKDTEL